MQHRCNAWCFDGVHAILFDSAASEWANREQVARTLVANLGWDYVDALEVRPRGVGTAGQPRPGGGFNRGRIVVFGRDPNWRGGA